MDGKPVSIEERVIAAYSVNKKEDVHSLRYILGSSSHNVFRWKLNLIAYYGNFQVHMNGYLSRIRHLRLPNKNLVAVNIKSLLSLELLDLSGNALRTVEGLEFATRSTLLYTTVDILEE